MTGLLGGVGGNSGQQTVDLGDGKSVVVPAGSDLMSTMHRNLFAAGDKVTMSFYASEDADSYNFADMTLLWGDHQFTYGDWTTGEAGDGFFRYRFVSLNLSDSATCCFLLNACCYAAIAITIVPFTRYTKSIT